MRRPLWLAGIVVLGLALFYLSEREAPQPAGLEAPSPALAVPTSPLEGPSGPPHVIVYLIDEKETQAPAAPAAAPAPA